MKSLFRFFVSLSFSASVFAAEPVQINWLGNTASPVATGVSWGVPWPKGAVKKDQKFSLASADGNRRRADRSNSSPPNHERIIN